MAYAALQNLNLIENDALSLTEKLKVVYQGRNWRGTSAPYFMMLSFYITGNNYVFARALYSIVFWLLFLSYMYLLAARYSSPKISVWIILLFSFYPGVFFSLNGFMSEAPFIGTMMGAFYHYLKSRAFTQLSHSAFFVFFTSIALTLRPVEASVICAVLFIIQILGRLRSSKLLEVFFSLGAVVSALIFSLPYLGIFFMKEHFGIIYWVPEIAHSITALTFFYIFLALVYVVYSRGKSSLFLSTMIISYLSCLYFAGSLEVLGRWIYICTFSDFVKATGGKGWGALINFGIFISPGLFIFLIIIFISFIINFNKLKLDVLFKSLILINTPGIVLFVISFAAYNLESRYHYTGLTLLVISTLSFLLARLDRKNKIFIMLGFLVFLLNSIYQIFVSFQWTEPKQDRFLSRYLAYGGVRFVPFVSYEKEVVNQVVNQFLNLTRKKNKFPSDEDILNKHIFPKEKRRRVALFRLDDELLNQGFNFGSFNVSFSLSKMDKFFYLVGMNMWVMRDLPTSPSEALSRVSNYYHYTLLGPVRKDNSKSSAAGLAPTIMGYDDFYQDVGSELLKRVMANKKLNGDFRVLGSIKIFEPKELEFFVLYSPRLLK